MVVWYSQCMMRFDSIIFWVVLFVYLLHFLLSPPLLLFFLPRCPFSGSRTLVASVLVILVSVLVVLCACGWKGMGDWECTEDERKEKCVASQTFIFACITTSFTLSTLLLALPPPCPNPCTHAHVDAFTSVLHSFSSSFPTTWTRSLAGPHNCPMGC